MSLSFVHVVGVLGVHSTVLKRSGSLYEYITDLFIHFPSYGHLGFLQLLLLCVKML